MFAVSSLLGAQTRYLPLDLGSQWVYRQTGPGRPAAVVVEVAEVKPFDGDEWARVTGFPGGDVWLRSLEDGSVWQRVPETGETRVWSHPGALVGEEWASGVDPCSGPGVVRARDTKWRGPIGQFENAVAIRYGPAGCADAGIEGDVFLPNVGLVERSFTTIAGPYKLQLIYARLGDVTVITSEEMSLSLSLDKSVYTGDRMPPVDPQRAIPVMNARLTLRNAQDAPLRIVLPSGQEFDLVIRDGSGQEVLRWSEGMFFTMALRPLVIPRGEKHWLITLPLAREGKNGREGLPAGRYTAEAYIATTEPTFRTLASFEIRYVD